MGRREDERYDELRRTQPWAQQEINQASVLMQYFGYLRRDANSASGTDCSGYDFWLNKLKTFGGNFRDAEMLKGVPGL